MFSPSIPCCCLWLWKQWLSINLSPHHFLSNNVWLIIVAQQLLIPFPFFSFLCYSANFLCWECSQTIKIPQTVQTSSVYEQNTVSVIMLATPKIMFLYTMLFKLGPINLSFTEMFSAEIMLMHRDTYVTFIGKVLKYHHPTGINSLLTRHGVI